MSVIDKPLLWFMFLLSVPCWLWYQGTGDLSLYFLPSVPSGQWLYVLSKLVGMLALTCIAWQVIVTLLIKLQWLPIDCLDRKWFGTPHRAMGVLIVALMFTHVLLFFSAMSLRQGELAWSLWLPNFSDFYHTHLSFGLIAMALMCVVAASGRIRSRRNSILANKFHRLYWVAISLIYFHGLAVGSESQSPAGLLFYLGMGVVSLFLAFVFVLRPIKTRLAVS
ncbi:MAG: hypothetical protein KUG80_04750 [Gammaproteobacteria bacterium]|nr:hypothetical protein [Gammaproteobacteria bacterium]